MHFKYAFLVWAAKVYNIPPEIAGVVTLTDDCFKLKWYQLKQIHRRRKRVECVLRYCKKWRTDQRSKGKV